VKKERLLAQLEEVTTDMWDGYVNAAKEVFGQDSADHRPLPMSSKTFRNN